ncbi:hypothetical protein EYF80_022084 [Liparis tanakae]|uniref:Uncharacterized protein n=1 Tax=Liparis tanakae TaxID=230148 RepID=A0A4Z2HPJ6_9TELE|nr:hypothetical protein EYF80_022084 [Liparis tanakae]
MPRLRETQWQPRHALCNITPTSSPGFHPPHLRKEERSTKGRRREEEEERKTKRGRRREEESAPRRTADITEVRREQNDTQRGVSTLLMILGHAHLQGHEPVAERVVTAC